MIYINNKEKMDRLKKIDNYYIITDFDRTLTTRKSEPTMGIVPQYLGGECLKKRTEIFNYYRPLELDYTIDIIKKQEIMKEWANKSFSLLSQYVTQDTIDKSLENANLYFRDGVKEFLQEMANKNIPIIVMSSGIGNIIKAFFEKEKCMFENIEIVSNFFEFIEEKTYINLNNLMATSNKDYTKIPEKLRKQLQNKQKAILLGDLVEDIKMIDKKQIDNTITIGFLDSKVESNLEVYNNNFDIVITNDGTFYDVKNSLSNL